ncbi:MAG: hypothetical protein KDA57_08155 [Planctomycetales bacterium]|nr:hypothetical protein [Planctomycetales bacterium]
MEPSLLLAQANTASDAFLGLEGEERFIVLLVTIGCATGIIISLTSIIAGVIGAVHKRNAEYELKREMLDRGMSADEIAKVIEAGPATVFPRWVSSWCKGNK